MLRILSDYKGFFVAGLVALVIIVVVGKHDGEPFDLTLGGEGSVRIDVSNPIVNITLQEDSVFRITLEEGVEFFRVDVPNKSLAIIHVSETTPHEVAVGGNGIFVMNPDEATERDSLRIYSEYNGRHTSIRRLR